MLNVKHRVVKNMKDIYQIYYSNTGDVLYLSLQENLFIMWTDIIKATNQNPKVLIVIEPVSLSRAI